MSEGKYFELSLNGTQLCVGEKCDRKQPVLCHHAEKDANQEWYLDSSSSTIRCKASDLCFTKTCNNRLELAAYDPAIIDRQKIEINEGRLICQGMEVGVDKKCVGACLCLKNCSAESCWQIRHLEPKLFYLEAYDGMVLSMEGGNRSRGVPVTIVQKENKGRPYDQLWYEDKKGNLRSAHNHLIPDASQPVVALQEYDGKPEQEWGVYGQSVFMKKDITKRLAVGQKSGCGRGVTVEVENRDRPEQKWNVVYID